MGVPGVLRRLMSTLDIKDAAIIAAKIAAQAVTGIHIHPATFSPPPLIWGAYNEPHYPGFNFDAALRWFNERALSVVLNDTTNNPYRGTTLRHDASILSTAGKAVMMYDAGLATGDTPTFAVQVRNANGTWRLSAQPWNGASLNGGAMNGTTQVMDGTVKTLTVTLTAIPADTTHIVVYTQETVAGASRVLDIYAWHGVKGTFLPSFFVPSASADVVNGRAPSNGLVYDPINMFRTPGVDFDGDRWVNANVLSRVTDSYNPWGTDSLQYVYNVSYLLAGKRLYCTDMNVRPGNILTFHAFVHGTDGENISLATRFYNASNVAIDVQREGEIQRLGGAGVIKTVTHRVVVPSTAFSVKLYVIRKSLAVNTMWICAMTGYALSGNGVVAPSVGDVLAEIHAARQGQTTLLAGMQYTASLAALSLFPTSLAEYGRHFLYNWHSQIAKIERALAGQQATMLIVGDSITNNNSYVQHLVSYFQTRYGNAGPGYVSASTAQSMPSGLTHGVTGVWSLRDNNTSPRGYAVDMASAYISTVGATNYWQSTSPDTAFTDARIVWRRQSGGGTFRATADGGANWTTISTAGAAGTGYTDLPSQVSGQYTVTCEVTAAGASGVEIEGAILRRLGGNGVCVCKAGNGGAAAVEYALTSATEWQEAITAINPDVILFLLGTNDHAQDVTPASFRTAYDTIVTRARTAKPSVDILLLCPIANNLTPDYPMTDYEAQIRDKATDDNLACVDLYKYMPDQPAAEARGEFDTGEGVHPNSTGGRVMADPIIRFMVPYA